MAMPISVEPKSAPVSGESTGANRTWAVAWSRGTFQKKQPWTVGASTCACSASYPRSAGSSFNAEPTGHKSAGQKSCQCSESSPAVVMTDRPRPNYAPSTAAAAAIQAASRHDSNPRGLAACRRGSLGQVTSDNGRLGNDRLRADRGRGCGRGMPCQPRCRLRCFETALGGCRPALNPFVQRGAAGVPVPHALTQIGIQARRLNARKVAGCER